MRRLRQHLLLRDRNPEVLRCFPRFWDCRLLLLLPTIAMQRVPLRRLLPMTLEVTLQEEEEETIVAIRMLQLVDGVDLEDEVARIIDSRQMTWKFPIQVPWNRCGKG